MAFLFVFQAEAAKKPINIAITCALTGAHAPVAGFCYGERDYYTFLNETRNGVNGHKFKVDLYDGAETPKELSTYRTFSPYVHSISLYSTMANKALRKEINEIDKIPTITGGMDERVISPYIFLIGPSYQKQFKISFEKMKNLGGKTVAISHGNYEWMVDMPKDAVDRKVPQKAGLDLVAVVEHETRSSDITAEFFKIKKANPDYIWLWGDVISGISASMRLGMPSDKLFVNHWFTLPVITEKFGKKVNGMLGWLMLPDVDQVLNKPDLKVAKELKTYFASHEPYTRNWTYIRGWLIGTLRTVAIERALKKHGNVIPKDIKEFRTSIRDELENIRNFDLGVGHGFEGANYGDHMGWGGMMPAKVVNGQWEYGKYESF